MYKLLPILDDLGAARPVEQPRSQISARCVNIDFFSRVTEFSKMEGLLVALGSKTRIGNV